MFSSIASGALAGISSYIVQVEVDASSGLPSFSMVGFPGSVVREAGERVRVAIKNSGIAMPPMRITVNLSPADIRKEGTAFDLPVAVGILTSLGHIPKQEEKRWLVLGELGLNGEIKGVKGVLPVVLCAKKEGYQFCIVPKVNREEGQMIDGISVLGVETLNQVVRLLTDGISNEEIEKIRKKKQEEIILEELNQEKWDTLPNFSDVLEQRGARRAAEVAAAGFHNLLLIGPPGAGKTMIAKCIPSILPPLSREEMLEVSAVYSVSGLLEGSVPISQRPFVSPHHTISEHALAGGGRVPRPGAVSLAHRGILFLDEMLEFKRVILDVLRQPLEDKVVHIARNTGSFTFPSDFMLVGAINPCPCGYYPDLNKCRCTPYEVKRYLGRLSGPILDRIDICVEVPPFHIPSMEGHVGEESAIIRERVMRARDIQNKRYVEKGCGFNAGLQPREITKYCQLSNESNLFIGRVFEKNGWSARAYHKVLKVARTIADLEGERDILKEHIAEAICYRNPDSAYFSR